MVEYYLDTDSIGGGDGTTELLEGATSAWAAISEITGVVAGDTVNLNCGDTWSETLTIPESGSVGNIITFGQYGSGDDPVIDGQDSLDEGLIVIPTGKNYITIENIALRNNIPNNSAAYCGGVVTNLVLNNISIDSPGNNGIYLEQIDTYTISNCTLTNVPTSGIVIYGSAVNNITNGTISGNTVDGVTDGDGITIHENSPYDGSKVVGATHVITGNTCCNCSENGIDLTSGTDITAVANTVYNNGDAGIVVGHSADTVTIDKNYVYDNGIGVDVNGGSANVTVKANLIVNPTTYSIIIGDTSGENADVDNTAIYNNTVIHTSNDSVVDIVGTNTDGITIKNNIFHNSGTGYFYRYLNTRTPANTHCEIDNNIYWRVGGSQAAFAYDSTNGVMTFSQWQALGMDAHSQFVDPQFTSYATNVFTLQNGSPARKAGLKILAVTEDKDEVSFGNPPSCGCYENENAYDGRNIASAWDLVAYAGVVNGNAGLGADILTNGNMELNANWSSYSAPSVAERSSEMAHSGDYSWKFTASSTGDGIINGTLGATITGKPYCLSFYTYPVDETFIQVLVRNGSDSGWNIDTDVTGLTVGVWNYVELQFVETAGGTGNTIYLLSGSSTDGTWYIDDVQYRPINNDIKGVQTADIDDLDNFFCIGNATIPFNGEYDGGGYEIRGGVFLSDGDVDKVGLFGQTGPDADIHDLGVTGAVIDTLADYAGLLIGYNGGNVDRCYTTGYVTGGTYVGGLIGFNAGTVDISYSTANVVALLDYAGGVVGFNADAAGAVITDCYNDGGTVTCDGGNVGGFAGGQGAAGSIVTSFSQAGTVSTTSGTAGGFIAEDAGTTTNCFWNTDTTEQATSTSGTGLTTAEFAVGSNFPGLDFTGEDAPWYMDYTRPELAWLGPPTFTITTIADVNVLASLVNAGGIVTGVTYANGLNYSGVTTHTPIGNTVNPANFVCNGNENTISNFDVDFGDISNAGYFGVTDIGFSLTKLILDGVSVTTTGDNVGALVGTNSGAITLCKSTGTITGNDNVGGLIGVNTGATAIVTNSYVYGGAVNANDYGGGFVGNNTFNGDISKCHAATGTVTVVVGSEGGFAGTDDADIEYCYFNSTTTGQSDDTGKGTPLTAAEYRDPNQFTGFSFDIWRMNQAMPEFRRFSILPDRHKGRYRPDGEYRQRYMV